ncbi:MAG: hypothetical protein ACI8Y7_000704 [Candidatus Woesearchaeota archaeon]|jgi:hypothetical protein
MKKRLTSHEEFEILKQVIDKFLWVGFGMLFIGFYRFVTDPTPLLWIPLTFVITGSIILAVLVAMLVKEYEI